MSKSRRERLRNEIYTLEDAILYAESKGISGLEEARNLLAKVKRNFEQGTWSTAERELSKAAEIKSSKWFLEFTKKREDKVKTGEKESEPSRFEGDGLCGKYGHFMVKIRLSNVRWYYQCRICGKRGKSQSFK